MCKTESVSRCQVCTHRTLSVEYILAAVNCYGSDIREKGLIHIPEAQSRTITRSRMTLWVSVQHPAAGPSGLHFIYIKDLAKPRAMFPDGWLSFDKGVWGVSLAVTKCVSVWFCGRKLC